MNQQRMGNPASRMGPQQRQPQGPGPRTQPFKITPSARNPPGAGAPAPPTGAERGPGGAVAGSGQESLSLQQLTAAEPHQQKQIIGEHLYRQIFSMYPTFAGKITGKCSTPQYTSVTSPPLPSGMLLEMDNSELLHMLESPESLKAKVDEAVAVLQEHHSTITPAAPSTTTIPIAAESA